MSRAGVGKREKESVRWKESVTLDRPEWRETRRAENRERERERERASEEGK